MKPWGFKLIFTAYIENDALVEARFGQVIAEVNEALGPGVNFLGVAVEEVADEPKDQIAT